MITKRYAIWFFICSLFFFFYPGNHEYYKLFSSYRNELSVKPVLAKNPVTLVTYNSEPPIENLSGEGIMVTHLRTFTPLIEKNIDIGFYPASTFKIMTALVAKDKYDINRIIRVNQPTPEGQVMGLTNGERMTVENLLYATLVYSANDAAEALARVEDRNEFIEAMNDKAQKLGMKSSLIVNPTGLDDQRQITTAKDLTLAARSLLKDPYLAKMVSTKEIIVGNMDFTKYYTLTNVNKLLGDIQGLGGLKTGFTELAGENLISYFLHNGEEYIIVVLKSKDRFNDTRIITNWIKTSVKLITIE